MKRPFTGVVRLCDDPGQVLLVEIAGAGHTLIGEKPEEAIRVDRTFLGRGSPTPEFP